MGVDFLAKPFNINELQRAVAGDNIGNPLCVHDILDVVKWRSDGRI